MTKPFQVLSNLLFIIFLKLFTFFLRAMPTIKSEKKYFAKKADNELNELEK
ncbi:MAG: hypothetical protein ACI9L6_000553 [Flavobacterium sp.]|jgi:hypothetical protein